MEIKRLLLVSSEFPPGPGGIGNHAQQLAVNLHRLGWEAVIVSPQDYASEEQAREFNSKQPIRIVSVPSGRGRFREAFHRLWIARAQARKQWPDIVVGTGLSGVWVAAALTSIHHLPSVAIAHGSEFGAGSGLSTKLNRMAFERMNAVVAVSQFTRGLLQKAQIKPLRTEVITNAADHHRFVSLPESERHAFRQKAGFKGAPLLVTVGHVSERKGQEVVIRALPRIVRQFPDAQYVMLGLPTLRPQLTRLAEQLGISNHVHFFGLATSDDLVRWLNCADVFVMTSRTTHTGDCEGFGIAVVEAALCGTPAVVSRQSGLIEAIQDGITGIAVPEGDEHATAEAVLSLLLDPIKRQAMGKAAHKRARLEQTWETCAQKYDNLFRAVIDRPSLNSGAGHRPLSK